MGIINSKKPNTLFRCLQQLLPVGTTHITTNGLHDVRNYEYADVSVPQGITPAGTINIENNGDYDVTSYANAHVAVSGGGITPTGTKNITANGVYDITTYANVDVNVSGGGNPHIYHGEFTKDAGNPIYIDDLNLKQNYEYPYYIVIKPKNEYDIPVQSTGKNLTLLFAGAFSKFSTLYSLGYTETYSEIINPTGRVTGTATQTMNAFFYYRGHEIMLNPTDLQSLLKDDVVYEYDVYVNSVTFDLSNATLVTDTYTFNVGDDLTFSPALQNVRVYVDNNLTDITRTPILQVGSINGVDFSNNDNIIVDFSNVDMSTAGTYTGYISVNWNTYKTFTVTVVVQ